MSNTVLIKSEFRCPHCQCLLDIEPILDTKEFKTLLARHNQGKVKIHKPGKGRPRKGENIDEYRKRVGLK